MRIHGVVLSTAAVAVLLGISGTYWIATPTREDLELAAPLQAIDDRPLEELSHARDFRTLARAFRPQIYRSFCGPASIATVLRAYGVQDADQTTVFPSWTSKVNAFYTGMTLAELETLARSAGLQTELVYANTLSLREFREHLKTNLARDGDFVVVNYDRRVLQQKGIGHISPVGAYDERRDAFLVLDEAAYRYPFTWVPAGLLYRAAQTRAGDKYRGMLFIQGYDHAD